MGLLTRSLEDAVARASTLPASEQDALAALLLQEIADERRWESLFEDGRSPTLLERLAAAALAEDEAGSTEPLEHLLGDSEDGGDNRTDSVR
jgi:hypothetical protein